MPGLLGVLDSASRSLNVTTRGIQTAGHNIANADTAGYSRQRQVVSPALPFPHPTGHIGNGVEAVTIERVTDPFLQRQMLRQGSLFGSADVQAQSLALVEEAFAGRDAGGLTGALGGFYDAFSDLSSAISSGAPVEREGVRSAAQALVHTLHGLDARLRAEQSAANDSINAVVQQINGLSHRIVALNDEIASLELQAPANDSRDARDQLVRELSELVDIDSFEQPDGRVVVALSSGFPLLSGNKAHELSAEAFGAYPGNPTFVSVRTGEPSAPVDLSDRIGGGRLGGLLRVRDSVLPSAIGTLDVLAFNLAETVNRLHATGTGLDGTVGNFFAAPATLEGAAGAIELDAAILNSPDAIAAGLTSAPSDNRVALEIAALRTTPASLYLPGEASGAPSGPSRTLLDQVSILVADVGQQARVAETARQQQGQILDNLHSRRESISGVSIDEEMTQLIELQAAFQANSRLIGLVDELLQDVMEIL